MLKRLFGHGGEPDGSALAVVDRAAKAIDGRSMAANDMRKLPAVAALLDVPDELRAEALQVLVRRLTTRGKVDAWGTSYALLSLLARRKGEVPPPAIADLLAPVEETLGAEPYKATIALEMLLPVLERAMKVATGAERTSIAARLARMLEEIERKPSARLKPTTQKRLRDLLPGDAGGLDAIATDDAVGIGMRAVVAASGEPPGALHALLAHLTAPTQGGKPSQRWIDTTRSLGAAVGDAPALVRRLIEASLDADDVTETQGQGGRVYTITRFVGPVNEAILRNAVWAAGALGDPDAIPALRSLCTKTITMIGGQFGYPRSLQVALACPGAIALTGSPAALTALQGLQRTIKHGSVLKAIGKAIDSLAANANVSRSELLETAVERHDLDGHGKREIQVGELVARIQVQPSGDVVVTWIDATGNELSGPPKRAKDEHAAAIKAVVGAQKAIRDTVAAERARLDRLFVERRTWPLGTWRERYLDHPVTGALTRGLIWRFQADGIADGIPNEDGTASAADGSTFQPPADAQVELWHPVGIVPDEVLRWRQRLMAEERRQPLKQAFREVYLLTPAEEATRTYSNRFARHIFRQVQARALMKGRGWAPVPLAWWDDGIDHGVTRRTFDAYALRAEFFYDPVVDVQPTSGDMYPYCTSDQVRFFRLPEDTDVPLAEIPPVLFSEVMRDVDLFIGVTSIGADPLWLDRGERRFDTYWQHWSFGELSQPAKVRRELLATILPALTIADRCTLEDRFLRVRGDLGSYRIHLGSGNIQMSPNDAYLCIVAARGQREDRVFLPFDDDPTLSIILSKAFLLANDGAITDQAILSQMGR